MLFRLRSVSESVGDLRCRRTCTYATLDFSIFQYVAAWQNACDIDLSIARDGTASREGVQERANANEAAEELLACVESFPTGSVFCESGATCPK